MCWEFRMVGRRRWKAGNLFEEANEKLDFARSLSLSVGVHNFHYQLSVSRDFAETTTCDGKLKWFVWLMTLASLSISHPRWTLEIIIFHLNYVKVSSTNSNVAAMLLKRGKVTFSAYKKCCRYLHLTLLPKGSFVLAPSHDMFTRELHAM